MVLLRKCSEDMRQAYLEAMGIQVWFPNSVLPRAKSARNILSRVQKTDTCDSQTKKNDTVVNNKIAQCKTPTSFDTKTGNKEGRLQALEMVKTFGFTSKDTEKLEGASEHAKQQPVAPFAFVVLSVTDSVLIVVELPVMNVKQGVTKQHRVFLNDVLWGLGYTEAVPSSAEDQQFIWPFGWPNNERGLLAQISQGEQAACEAVRAYLEHQFYVRNKKVLLIFGKTIAQYVLASNVSFTKGGWQVINENKNVLVSYSLDELITIPGLKREFWADMCRSLQHDQK